MATERPVVKTLIKYNSNYLEVNDEEEKEPIHIEFTEQNADRKNNENDIDIRLLKEQQIEEEDIALANFI